MTTVEVVFWSSFLFALGAIIGSFLNVCIWRLPTDRSIVWPGSHCPRCLTFLRWYDNIPLVSYAVLRARCRYCGTHISARYPIIEALTALSFVGLYWWDIVLPDVRFPNYYVLAVHCYVMANLIAGSLIDLDYYILPDELTQGGLLVGLAASALVPALHASQPALTGIVWIDGVAWSVVGALVGAGLTYGIGAFGTWLFKKDAMGFGDVKLMAMLGAFFGWDGALLIFFIGPFFGLLIGGVLALRRRTRAIPYGPFLAMAAIVVMLLKPQIIDALFPAFDGQVGRHGMAPRGK